MLFFLPYKIVTSFTNFHATAIVGMWAALPKDYKTESNNMFRNLSVMALLPQNVIFKSKYSTKSTTQIQSLTHDSAIGFHLLCNPTCAQHYDDSMFSILAKGRSPFHLSALEATFIKTSNPILCRQKEFVYNLKILNVSAEL